MKTLKKSTRILLVVAALMLLAVLFLPIWRIELSAPQYPEGLKLLIYANGLRGNVDIINGLNHYIGMNTLHSKDFIEFTLLPYIISFFAAAFILIAVINKRKWVNAALIVFILFGIVAMVDFWRWEYNYGHNLNPNAAIIVPGMAYQPPLIGYKQLLNFGAYSIPDFGGWLFIAAGLLLLVCVIIEWKKSKIKKSTFSTAKIAAALGLLFYLSGCNTSVEAIKPGIDDCASCKMRITDARYGAELITKKGKVYKFDDIHCILSFINASSIDKKDIKDVYLVDFAGDHSLVKATEGFLLKSDGLHAPMNGNVVAFRNKDSMKKVAQTINADEINWNELLK